MSGAYALPAGLVDSIDELLVDRHDQRPAGADEHEGGAVAVGVDLGVAEGAEVGRAVGVVAEARRDRRTRVSGRPGRRGRWSGRPAGLPRRSIARRPRHGPARNRSKARRRRPGAWSGGTDRSHASRGSARTAPAPARATAPPRSDERRDREQPGELVRRRGRGSPAGPTLRHVAVAGCDPGSRRGRSTRPGDRAAGTGPRSPQRVPGSPARRRGQQVAGRPRVSRKATTASDRGLADFGAGSSSRSSTDCLESTGKAFLTFRLNRAGGPDRRRRVLQERRQVVGRQESRRGQAGQRPRHQRRGGVRVVDQGQPGTERPRDRANVDKPAQAPRRGPPRDSRRRPAGSPGSAPMTASPSRAQRLGQDRLVARVRLLEPARRGGTGPRPFPTWPRPAIAWDRTALSAVGQSPAPGHGRTAVIPSGDQSGFSPGTARPAGWSRTSEPDHSG